MNRVSIKNQLLSLAVVTAVICSLGISTAEASTSSIRRGPNTTSAAIMTFDDCPYGKWTGHAAGRATPLAPSASAGLANYKATIDALVANKVSVAIAPTGYCVNMYKKYFGIDIAAYARERGQYVMSHGYNHRHSNKISNAAVRYQLDHGVKSYWFRPPYGEANARVRSVIASKQMRAWTWTKTAQDWRGRSQASIVAYNKAYCRNGDTCLMHLQWNGFSPEAINKSVAAMRASGTNVCGMRVDANGAPVRTAVRWVKLDCAN